MAIGCRLFVQKGGEGEVITSENESKGKEEYEKVSSEGKRT